jgi:hypothetical protein
MSVLREFSFEQTVSAEDAKHDKITLHVRHRIYQGTRKDIGDFRHSLAIAPATYESTDAIAVLGHYHGRLFNRPSESGSFWKPLEIRQARKGSNIAVPLPLFGGKYKFLSRPSDSEQPLQTETALELFLNPTRFLTNQDLDYIPPRRDFAITSARFYESASPNEGDPLSG